MTAAGALDGRGTYCQRMRAIVWFRSDLRTTDHPALSYAARRATGVIGVFVATPGQWRSHEWGHPKTDFILRSVQSLSTELASCQIPLLVRVCDRFDGVPQVLLGLARRHRCNVLCFNREPEVNERRRDDAVERVFRNAGLQVQAFEDQAVFSPGSVLTADGSTYKVFSPYKRAWLERLREEGVPRPLSRPRRQPPAPVRSDPLPSSLARLKDPAIASIWPAGHAEAARRLRRFIASRIDGYAERRDYPSEHATSTLSPYLAAGCISARQCLHAALAPFDFNYDAANAGTQAWVSQLIWRDFYRHLIVAFPRLCMNQPFNPSTRNVRWRRSGRDLTAWKQGRTGYPIVDAAMRCLASTGWMHNRLRMIVAGFLTKDLLIHWREGERHFARYLVDLDLANNNGGWQWAASTGTDAAPYFRVFHPVTQGKRFDPDAAFIHAHVPELAGLETRYAHEPWKLSPADRRRLPYPSPICDHAEARQRAIEAFRAARA